MAELVIIYCLCGKCNQPYDFKWDPDDGDYFEHNSIYDDCPDCWEAEQEKQWARAGLAACLGPDY